MATPPKVYTQPMFLVTGGAGYIGSHVCKLLREKRIDHVVFDNLERGHQRAAGKSSVFFGDVRDRISLDRLFSEFDIDLVKPFEVPDAQSCQHVDQNPKIEAFDLQT